MYSLSSVISLVYCKFLIDDVNKFQQKIEIVEHYQIILSSKLVDQR